MEKYQSNENIQSGHEQQIEAWRDKVIAQVLDIRDSGATNMFDVRKVFELALSLDFEELADFLFMDTPAYGNFILTGDRELLVKAP